MSPEDEIRVLELIAGRPSKAIYIPDEAFTMSRRKRARVAEIRYVVEQMLAEYDDRVQQRQGQAVTNAIRRLHDVRAFERSVTVEEAQHPYLSRSGLPTPEATGGNS